MLVFLTAFRDDPEKPDKKKIVTPAVVAASPAIGMPTLSITTSRELFPQVAAAARALPEVVGVAEMSEATRWLDSWNETGQPANRPPAGFQIPMDVGSINPAEYQTLFPEGEAGQLRDLPVDAAIISRTAAGLRGIKRDGYLLIQGRNLRVVGVVDDELTRNHEVIVNNQTGDSLGTGQSRYLEVMLGSFDDAPKVARELRKLIPSGVPARVRGPLTSGFGDGGRLLSLGAIKATFGEFAAQTGHGTNIVIPQEWIDSRTAVESVPLLGEFRCNKDLFPQLRGAMANIEREGLSYLINSSDFGGCFSARFTRSGDNLSRHAWGIGVDLNVNSNLMGQTPRMDPQIIKIMEDWGFSWGGNWTVPDGMHFEYVKRRTE